MTLSQTLSQTERLAFTGGTIFTVNENQPEAEAVVTEGNKIIFVGKDADAQKFINEHTQVIDLNGKLMLPGFIDSHLHFIDGGLYLMGIDLRPAKSKEEFAAILKDHVNKFPGRWVKGGRWDHEQWSVIQLPTKDIIDPFTENTPVFVSRIDGHIGVANSLALKLAGITKDTPDPDGGLIHRDESGEPTGILVDNAMKLVFNIIPSPSEEDLSEALNTALNYAAKLGITSVHDKMDISHLSIYKNFEEEGKLTCRIYGVYPVNNYRYLIDNNIKSGNGSDKFKLGAVKAYSDGSLGAMSAWFHQPYEENPSTYGLPNDIITDGRLRQWALDIDKNQLQICTHAIGDKANTYMLDLYEEIKNSNPVWDRRFRIEHAQHILPQDFKRFSETGVIASVQPYHAIDDGVWAEKRIGKERINYTHAYKTFLEHNVIVSFGTDWPVAPLNPMLGLYAAATRRTVDNKNPDGWIPEQKISVEEAIRCYTLNSAYAGFMEDKTGSIEVGKLADLIVIDRNLLSLPPDEIKDAKVIMTVFDGKIIHKTD